tara:strand:+ start:331 stop:789 length:459 start_codon:yes stop_codon:yes gene_type:complete
MGKFNNKISAEFHPPKKWILERPLSYQNEEIDEVALEAVGVKCPASKITCAKGFVTDLASVPRAIWWLISPWDIARAAIIHDLLYKRIRQYRAKEGIHDEHSNVKAAKKASDNVFLMAMKDADPDIPKWKMYAAYYAVVLCGRWSIIPREED